MKKWILICSFLLFVTACEKHITDTTSTGDTINQVPVELVDVIDGDTIKVNYNGKTETIRYLLIDTPEVRHQTLGNQPGGDESSARHKELLNDADITLEFDVGDRMDDYGRLLAYVYADGKSVQEILLREGLARVAYIFPPSTRYLEPFEDAQAIAEKGKLGVWEIDNYVTDRGFDSSVVGESGDCLIKGNISREGKKIYHKSDGQYYIQTNPEEWFCTEEEARAAGFKKSGQ